MTREIEWKGKKWISASRPTSEDLTLLIQKYDIHPIILDDLSRPTLRPRAERFAHFLYLILHFPECDTVQHICKVTEIDFVVGRNFLLTVSYDGNNALETFFDRAIESELRTQHALEGGIGILLHKLLRHIYQSILTELDETKLEIDAIASEIEKNLDKKTIEQIAFLRKDILNFSRAIKPHESVLESLEAYGKKFFGDDIQPYLQDVSGEYFKTWNELQNQKEIIEALYDTHLSLLSLRSAEIMKKLTLMAFITFPMTLTASIFAMKVTPDVFIGSPYDFIIVVGVIFIAVLAMLIFFRHRRWL